MSALELNLDMAELYNNFYATLVNNKLSDFCYWEDFVIM